jgi:hypothetical protein
MFAGSALAGITVQPAPSSATGKPTIAVAPTPALGANVGKEKSFVAPGSDRAKRVGTLAGAPTREPQNQTVVAAPSRDFAEGKAVVVAPIKPAALAKEQANFTSGNYGYSHSGHTCENDE